MKHRVLIVDPDQPFAEMLSQGLSDTGDIAARAVNSGKDAMAAMQADKYDLVIVDMGLRDVAGTALVQALRKKHPSLPLVVIPLQGDDLPPELAGIEIQGTLPKPFFLPELPDRIRAVLVEAHSSVPSEQEEKFAAPGPVPGADVITRIELHLARLAQETGAQAIMVTHDKNLLTHVSRLPDGEVVSLAGLVYDSWHTSTRVAEILGKEQLRFEQSIEGGEYLLYSLALSSEIILSVVVDGHVPLGMIRHRAKETAEEIRKLIASKP